MYQIVNSHANNEEFREALRILCSDSSPISSYYSYSALGYYRRRAQDEGWSVKNCSYALIADGVPAFACIAYYMKKDNREAISSFEWPIIFIEADGLKSRSLKKAISASLEDKLFARGCPIVAVDHVNHKSITYAMEYIMKTYQGKSRIEYSRHINLTQNVQEIRRGIRKSYISLINWGLRELEIQVYTGGQVKWESIDELRRLHIRESRRETRSEETWRMQYESVLQKEAFCILGRQNNEIITGGLFWLSCGHCYYGVSASRRDMFDRPLFHGLMWRSILYAKEMGATSFELGPDYTTCNIRDEQPSHKQIQIAKFKSGFGGHLRPLIQFRTNANEFL